MPKFTFRIEACGSDQLARPASGPFFDGLGVLSLPEDFRAETVRPRSRFVTDGALAVNVGMAHTNSESDSGVAVQMIKRCFDDSDEQAECLTGYNQTYSQLSPGRFSGQLAIARFGPELGLTLSLTIFVGVKNE
ncbi:MAG: hypothetical protein KZQ97_17895 [Candidatus Thiodiazotropha sp. (ex Dulcina madagascariensis)]|nr:hypothetical protein [Candidatus Thiodiazotropha sp. (ex Dulcina madagascariensis)]